MTFTIAIIYHSGFGHTQRVAEAIAEGITQVTDADAALINVDIMTEQDWETLDNAHTIIFGSPTYMGGVSAQFKTFIDKASIRWIKHEWKDKFAAGFTNSGSYSGDKLSTLMQLMINAMQHGMIWIGQGELPPSNKGATGPDDNAINRLGCFVGLMTQANNDDPAITPPKGDIDTSILFGIRIAEQTKRLL